VFNKITAFFAGATFWFIVLTIAEYNKLGVHESMLLGALSFPIVMYIEKSVLAILRQK